jgi:hypothetical protein
MASFVSAEERKMASSSLPCSLPFAIIGGFAIMFISGEMIKDGGFGFSE